MSLKKSDIRAVLKNENATDEEKQQKPMAEKM